MKYTVIDIKGGISIPMADEAAVARWWKDRFGSIWQDSCFSQDFFREMNLTGKDIRGDCELRQFQVRDEYGRPVDIRTWPHQVWKTSPPAYDLGSIPRFSKKKHIHRITGPKMRRQALRALANDTDLGDVEQIIVLDKSRAARKSRDCTCGRASDTRRYWNREHISPSRCWKDQTKAKRQYAKHHQAPEMQSDKRAREDFAFIQARLGADGIGSRRVLPYDCVEAV